MRVTGRPAAKPLKKEVGRLWVQSRRGGFSNMQPWTDNSSFKPWKCNSHSRARSLNLETWTTALHLRLRF